MGVFNPVVVVLPWDLTVVLADGWWWWSRSRRGTTVQVEGGEGRHLPTYLPQKQKAVREEGGEGDKEEDSGVQLPAGCGEPLLVHLGDVGDVQVTRKLLETQLEGQEW